MKKLMFILLLMLPVCAFSQTESMNMSDTSMVAKKYELDYMRYCLKNYYKQRQIGITLVASGTTVSMLSLGLIDPEKNQKEIALIGGGVALIGSLIMLDADKWIKHASIEPSTSGVGFKINFNKPKPNRKVRVNDYDDLYR